MISTLFLFLLVAASAQISDDVLQQIWDERPDLQSRFPKVGLGEYDKMMQWAIDEGWNQDVRLAILVPHDTLPEYVLQNYYLMGIGIIVIGMVLSGFVKLFLHQRKKSRV